VKAFLPDAGNKLQQSKQNLNTESTEYAEKE